MGEQNNVIDMSPWLTSVQKPSTDGMVDAYKVQFVALLYAEAVQTQEYDLAEEVLACLNDEMDTSLENLPPRVIEALENLEVWETLSYEEPLPE